MPAPEQLVPVRVVLRRPPAGVRFALQQGSATADGEAQLAGAREADGAHDLTFECAIRARVDDRGAPRFLGPFVHGPTSSRFMYVVVGTRAGQAGSPWDRRAKVPLTGITAALISAALASPGAVLQATIEGTLADGSPVCATQPFVDGGWVLASTEQGSVRGGKGR